MPKTLSNLDLNKNELQNAVIQKGASAPSSPKEGQVYYNTTDKNFYRYNGTSWVTYQVPLTETGNELAPVYINSSGLPTVADGVIRVDTASTNLNDYITKGVYYFSSSYTPLNVPPLPSSTIVNGTLEVIANDTKTSDATLIKQFWYRAGTLNSNSWQYFERTGQRSDNVTSWSEWQRILNVGWDSTNNTYAKGSATSPIYINSSGTVLECSLTAAAVGAVATTAIGAASGVAPLNSSSKVDDTYLPVASITASGIITTSDQTLLGPKGFQAASTGTNEYLITFKNGSGELIGHFRQSDRGTTSNTGTIDFVLGNSKNSTTNNNSEGQIFLYSSNTNGHWIKPTSVTTVNKEHYLPAESGWLVTGGNGTSTGVGGNQQPVYLDDTGVLQGLTGITTIDTAGEDLNNYKTTGIYDFNTSTNTAPTNIPTGVNGILVVITNAGYGSAGSFGKQFWYRRGTIASNSMQSFYRTWSGTTWEPWQRIVNVEYGTAVGSSVQPIYLNTNGVPTTCSLTAASVGAAPTIKTDTITFSSTWSGSGPYTQTVTLGTNTPTANSKIDLQPSATDFTTLQSDGVQLLYISNTNGTLTAYSVGGHNSSSITIQCTITEIG